MVHALEECRRVLRPGGLLIDLRPFPGNWPLEVVGGPGVLLPSVPGRGADGWTAGALDDSPVMPDNQAANAAIAQAVRNGWFRQERATTFEYAWYWASLAELDAYMAERWTNVMRFPEPTRAAALRLLAEAAAPGAPPPRLRLGRGMLLARYRRVD